MVMNKSCSCNKRNMQFDQKSPVPRSRILGGNVSVTYKGASAGQYFLCFI